MVKSFMLSSHDSVYQTPQHAAALAASSKQSPDTHDIIVDNAFMPNELVSLRLPEDMLERIDQHAADLTEYTGGVPITRAEVIRKFVAEGLRDPMPLIGIGPRPCLRAEEAEETVAARRPPRTARATLPASGSPSIGPRIASARRRSVATGHCGATRVLRLLFRLCSGARIDGTRGDFVAFAEHAQPVSAAAFVAAAPGLGLKTIIDTAHDAREWALFASLGFDAIYVDDVPMGVALQPCDSSCDE
jgi:hypothetical protein